MRSTKNKIVQLGIGKQKKDLQETKKEGLQEEKKAHRHGIFTCLRPCDICINNDFSTVNNTHEMRKHSEKMRTRQNIQDVN